MKIKRGENLKPFPFYYKTLPAYHEVRKALKERDSISVVSIDETWFTVCHKHHIFQMWNQEYITSLSKEILTLMGEDPILEVCAGDGMLSHWLREYGVNIRATDNMSRHRNHGLKLHSEVEELDAISAIHKYNPRLVLASWIEYGSELDCEILDEEPEYLILIGEGEGGCTGSHKFSGGWNTDSPPAYWIQKGYNSRNLNADKWIICRTDYDWNRFNPHGHTVLYSIPKEEKPMVKRVKPISIEGHNISWNLNLLSGPKFTIRCGNCTHTFKERIAVVDYPTALCPACGAINELNLVVESLAETARR